jgi:hypothetical protein
MSEPELQLLTYAQVARQLQISVRTLRRLLKARNAALVYLSRRSVRVPSGVMASLIRPTTRKESRCDP